MTEAESMLPKHLVTYVDEKMIAHTERIEKMLKDHIDADFGQLNEIKTCIKILSDLVANQHTTVMAHWSAHELRTSAIERAFLEDHKGRPDYAAHYGEHDERKRGRTVREDLRNRLILGVATPMAIAFCLWSGFVVWKAAVAVGAGP